MSTALFPEISVNGTRLASALIAAEAQNHHAPKGKPGLAWRKAAQALAIRQVLLDEAAARNLSPEPKEVAPGRVETPDDARIRELLDEAVTPAPVSEAALRAAYDRDPGAHRAPALYQPAHILFAVPAGDEAGRAEAGARAQAVIATLQRAPERFAQLARSESDCPSRDAGGQLGQLTSGDTVPEFEAALRAMAPGTIRDTPVETRYGVHVVRLDAWADGAVLPFERVRARLAEASEKANWAGAARAFVAELVSKAEITGIEMSQVG